VKLEIWSPLPPARSGVADHVAETLPLLVGRAEVGVVVPDPSEVDPAAAAWAALRSPEESDPDAARLYVLGNSRWHSFAYRVALRRPGVLLLHEWSLHGLVLRRPSRKRRGYRRLMPAYGTTQRLVQDGRFCPRAEPSPERARWSCRAVAATTVHGGERVAPARSPVAVLSTRPCLVAFRGGARSGRPRMPFGHVPGSNPKRFDVALRVGPPAALTGSSSWPATIPPACPSTPGRAPPASGTAAW
jgi:hypothetical protein